MLLDSDSRSECDDVTRSAGKGRFELNRLLDQSPDSCAQRPRLDEGDGEVKLCRAGETSSARSFSGSRRKLNPRAQVSLQPFLSGSFSLEMRRPAFRGAKQLMKIEVFSVMVVEEARMSERWSW